MTDLTSNSFVYNIASPHEDSGLMPTLNFDDLLGRTFILPAHENESENEPTSLNISPILKIPKLPKKIRCIYASKFKTSMNLKSSFPTIMSWISWNRVLT